MGQNLILNAADHGYTVVAFNRTVSKVDKFLENEAKGKSVVGAHSIKAQDSPPHDASRHGRKARRRLH
jgi:6-phosphogluconate dehydrogenase